MCNILSDLFRLFHYSSLEEIKNVVENVIFSFSRNHSGYTPIILSVIWQGLRWTESMCAYNIYLRFFFILVIHRIWYTATKNWKPCAGEYCALSRKGFTYSFACDLLMSRHTVFSTSGERISWRWTLKMVSKCKVFPPKAPFTRWRNYFTLVWSSCLIWPHFGMVLNATTFNCYTIFITHTYTLCMWQPDR